MISMNQEHSGHGAAGGCAECLKEENTKLRAEVERLKDQGKTACDLFDELKKSQAEVRKLDLQVSELEKENAGQASMIEEALEEREQMNRLNNLYRKALEEIAATTAEDCHQLGGALAMLHKKLAVEILAQRPKDARFIENTCGCPALQHLPECGTTIMVTPADSTHEVKRVSPVPNNEVRCMCDSHCEIARRQERERCSLVALTFDSTLWTAEERNVGRLIARDISDLT